MDDVIDLGTGSPSGLGCDDWDAVPATNGINGNRGSLLTCLEVPILKNSVGEERLMLG